MHPERPITKHDADAFDGARRSTVGPERRRNRRCFHGERCTVGTVCDHIGLFSAPMPAGIYGFLYSLALQHYIDSPDDYTYASGAKCLRAIHNKYMARIEAGRP